MSDGDPLVDEVATPALLRAARRTYGRAIRRDLERAGFDDIPANGLFVLGALAREQAPLSEIISWLGTSKQAAGQLVDVLVTRRYLDREVDPGDRRRLVVSLTERGQAAAAVIRAAVTALDAALEAEVGAQAVLEARRVLAALVRMKDRAGQDQDEATQPDA